MNSLISSLNLIIIWIWLDNIFNRSITFEYSYVCNNTISTNNPIDVLFNWHVNKSTLKKNSMWLNLIIIVWIDLSKCPQ